MKRPKPPRQHDDATSAERLYQSATPVEITRKGTVNFGEVGSEKAAKGAESSTEEATGEWKPDAHGFGSGTSKIKELSKLPGAAEEIEELKREKYSAREIKAIFGDNEIYDGVRSLRGQNLKNKHAAPIKLRGKYGEDSEVPEAVAQRNRERNARETDEHWRRMETEQGYAEFVKQYWRTLEIATLARNGLLQLPSTPRRPTAGTMHLYPEPPKKKPGRKPFGEKKLSRAEIQRRYREKKKLKES
jgi:hypothetical protein